ncbi:MAG: Clp protease ClpP [Ruminococcus flavefaciens]|nr:Clp protease ClpP [Ruminococcus flavefaciens]
MMTKINVKGTVVSNDDADIYDWLNYDYVSPSQVEDILNNADDEVRVDINSGGGSVFAASEIYSMLKDYSGKVTVNIQGLAASAASVIAMAGDEINMSPTAQMMIHKASTISMGNADDFAHDSSMLDTTDQSIVNAYEAKTGMNRDDILQMMSNETWMTAQDAVDKGFADSILCCHPGFI